MASASSPILIQSDDDTDQASDHEGQTESSTEIVWGWGLPSVNNGWKDPTSNLPRERQIEERKAMIAEMVTWQPPRNSSESYELWREDCKLYVFLAGNDPTSIDNISTYVELDEELKDEYRQKSSADRNRYRIEMDAFDSSLPLARKPSLGYISTSSSREQKYTWLDICGSAVDQASANRALLWSRYRRDYRDNYHDATCKLSQQTFDFAVLPPEIKREIYCWLLTQSRPVIHCSNKYTATERERPLDLRILAVSHASYSEALAVFLEKNVVKMRATSYTTCNVVDFVTISDRARMSFIRCRMTTVLILMTYPRDTEPACYVKMAQNLCADLSRLTNLKELKVEFCYRGSLNEHETEKLEREVLGCFDALKSCGNFATVVSACQPELRESSTPKDEDV